jgi:hypothetical protein
MELKDHCQNTSTGMRSQNLHERTYYTKQCRILKHKFSAKENVKLFICINVNMYT